MPNKINGRFYFKRTSNGNLIGEFSNNVSVGTATESSDYIGRKNNNTESNDLNELANGSKFLGIYHSTWQENGQPLFADLMIDPKPNSNQLLSLKWGRKGSPIFEGEGMLCDDILIGNYWTA